MPPRPWPIGTHRLIYGGTRRLAIVWPVERSNGTVQRENDGRISSKWSIVLSVTVQILITCIMQVIIKAENIPKMMYGYMTIYDTLRLD